MNLQETIRRILKEETEGIRPFLSIDNANLVIFIGGMETNKSLDYQYNLFKNGSGLSNVKKFGRLDIGQVINFLNKNKVSGVVMFSDGCRMADEISEVRGINKNKIFCVEPWAKNGNTNVSTAVNNGVPSENIFTGPVKERGLGVVINSTKTKGTNHFDALYNSAKIIGQRI